MKSILLKSKRNPEEFHSSVKSKNVMTNSIGSVFTEDGELVQDDEDMAKVLKYFFFFYPCSPLKTTPFAALVSLLADDNNLQRVDIYDHDVLSTLNTLKISKTAAPHTTHFPNHTQHSLLRPPCLHTTHFFTKSSHDTLIGVCDTGA